MPPGLLKLLAKEEKTPLTYEQQYDVVEAEERAIIEHQRNKTLQSVKSWEESNRPVPPPRMSSTGRMSGLPVASSRKTRAPRMTLRERIEPQPLLRLSGITEGGALAYNRLTVKELKAAIHANPVARNYLKGARVAQPRKAHLVVALEYAENNNMYRV